MYKAALYIGVSDWSLSRLICLCFPYRVVDSVKEHLKSCFIRDKLLLASKEVFDETLGLHLNVSQSCVAIVNIAPKLLFPEKLLNQRAINRGPERQHDGVPLQTPQKDSSVFESPKSAYCNNQSVEGEGSALVPAADNKLLSGLGDPGCQRKEGMPECTKMPILVMDDVGVFFCVHG